MGTSREIVAQQRPIEAEKQGAAKEKEDVDNSLRAFLSSLLLFWLVMRTGGSTRAGRNYQAHLPIEWQAHYKRSSKAATETTTNNGLFQDDAQFVALHLNFVFSIDMLNVPPHWRDPMQWGFLCAASFVRGISCFMRYAGVFCVAVGMLLIFLVGGLFLHAVIPIMADSTLQLICHVVVALILLFNIYFNYALCCATNPGVITAKWKVEAELWDVDIEEEEEEEEEEEDNETDLLPRIRPSAVTPDGKPNGGKVKLPQVQLMDPQSVHVARQRGRHPNADDGMSFCRRCRHFRPPRAHHCSVCDRCIAHLDHHCPWVNNCIGRDNYRYFFTFLVWLAVGSYYAAYMSYRAAFTELSREQYARMLVLAEIRSLNMSASNALQFAFSMSAAAGLAVSILATWHVFLIITAQTSVELQINRHPRNRRLHGGKVVSPYSTGSIHGNWELVFGRCSYKISSLMPSTRLPPNPRTLSKKTKVEQTTARSPDAIV